jgi:hypothetical protein
VTARPKKKASLRPDPSSLADLTPDPRNARKHSPRNVGTIVDALHEVGAARSIVIDENGVILAGNATAEAAAEAGITTVRVVDASGSEIIAVRRSGLTKSQKAKLALYDNRAAELADGWDLSVLEELQAEGLDLSSMWLENELWPGKISGEDGAEALLGGMEYRVVVDVANETEQAQLIERLEAEGLICRPLIS